MPCAPISRHELDAVRSDGARGRAAGGRGDGAAPAEAPAWRSPSPSPTSPASGRSSRSPARSAPSPRAASMRSTDRSSCSSRATASSALGTDPQAAALTVLGMGKLGAGELNYSSDIDLILLYDREAPALAGNEQLSRHFVRGRAHAGAAHVGDLGRRLHLPHRPPAAPRPRLDAARHVGAGGRALLRKRRPELGTRGHDQGASRGRQPRRRRGLPGAISRPISGASISTSRRSTTSIRSSARSTPIAAAAPSRCWATTSSSAAAASARSSSSPRPSS